MEADAADHGDAAIPELILSERFFAAVLSPSKIGLRKLWATRRLISDIDGD